MEEKQTKSKGNVKEILLLLGIPQMSMEGNLGDNWKTWKEKFLLYLKATDSDKLEQAKQVDLLLKLMGEKSYNIFTSLQLNKEEVEDLETVLKKFENFFMASETMTVKRHRFFSRVQMQNESVEAFAVDLVNKSYPCMFGELKDGLIRNMLICGLLPSYSHVKDRLMKETDPSLDKTLEICSNAGPPKYEEFYHYNEEEPMVTVKNFRTYKEVPTGEKLQQFISHCIQSPRNIVLSLCAAVLLFGVIFTIIYMSTSKVQDAEESQPTNTSRRILSRGEWAAEPTEELQPLLVNPPKYVIITHTAGSKCSTISTCSTIVKNIQAGHCANGWDDIAYNFLVGGDGYAYEGRGWGKKGAHSLKFNGYSIAIAFIGNFNNYPPPKRQIEAARLVMEEGVRLGKLQEDYKILYHAQVTSTESPGSELIPEVKTWNHWSECDEDCKKIISN